MIMSGHAIFEVETTNCYFGRHKKTFRRAIEMHSTDEVKRLLVDVCVRTERESISERLKANKKNIEYSKHYLIAYNSNRNHFQPIREFASLRSPLYAIVHRVYVEQVNMERLVPLGYHVAFAVMDPSLMPLAEPFSSEFCPPSLFARKEHEPLCPWPSKDGKKNSQLKKNEKNRVMHTNVCMHQIMYVKN